MSKTIDEFTGLEIDETRIENFNKFSQDLLKGFYVKDDETVQQAFARASFAWCGGDKALAQRLYDAVSKKWFMFASPVLSNAPRVKSLNPLVFEKEKSLPISCFLSEVGDSLESLIGHTTDLRWLSVLGGGVGGHWSKVRGASDKSPGTIPFLHTTDADMEAYRQGRVRRGSYAAYLDISHPDIVEFLKLRVPTGDESRKCHSTGFNHGINITDEFMEAVEQGKEWKLIDPHSKDVRETLDARTLWEDIMNVRYRTGEPYLYFIDAANRSLPEAQKNLGLRSNGSNLCVEIIEPTSPDRIAVCCLSSLNVEKYDEWKDTTLVADLVRMLDNVIEYFIHNAPEVLKKAAYSASRERAIGLGLMGLHHYFQKNMIAFDSVEARDFNKKIFQNISEQAEKASLELGKEYGECPDFITEVTFKNSDGEMKVQSSDFIKVGETVKRAFEVAVGDVLNGFEVKSIQGLHNCSGRRNTQLTAIAPNGNSAILVGTSPSVEPNTANAYSHQTRAGSHEVINPHLKELLKSKGKDTEEVWQSILTEEGSVQQLDFLTDHEKSVFKTAEEINQQWIVTLASDRQPFITQSQSINLFFSPKCDLDFYSRVHYTAWKKGMKSLYYSRTRSSTNAEKISMKIERNALKNGDEIEDDGECTACQG